MSCYHAMSNMYRKEKECKHIYGFIYDCEYISGWLTYKSEDLNSDSIIFDYCPLCGAKL